MTIAGIARAEVDGCQTRPADQDPDVSMSADVAQDKDRTLEWISQSLTEGSESQVVVVSMETDEDNFGAGRLSSDVVADDVEADQVLLALPETSAEVVVTQAVQMRPFVEFADEAVDFVIPSQAGTSDLEFTWTGSEGKDDEMTPTEGAQVDSELVTSFWIASSEGEEASGEENVSAVAKEAEEVTEAVFAVFDGGVEAGALSCDVSEQVE